MARVYGGSNAAMRPRACSTALRLDPADRQGVRPLLSAMRAGAPWSDRERS
jgi:hypothetical protein